MAAAVSVASTLRLISGRAGLSDESALADGTLEVRVVGTDAGGCAVRLLKATGFAITGGEVITAAGVF
jgi:hypothetical protein